MLFDLFMGEKLLARHSKYGHAETAKIDGLKWRFEMKLLFICRDNVIAQ